MKTYTDPQTGKQIVDIWADRFPLPQEWYDKKEREWNDHRSLQLDNARTDSSNVD